MNASQARLSTLVVILLASLPYLDLFSMRLIIFAVLPLVLTGCAIGPLSETGTFLPPLHRQALDHANICCGSYRDIQYETLQRGVEVSAVITPSSPTFEFGGKKSFFAAYELPAGENRFLVVTTVPVNMVWNPAGHVMVPSVQFIDSAYKSIDILQPRYETDSGWRGSWAEALVKVPNDAKYAILVDTEYVTGLSWRSSDRASGSLFVRSGPTGKISVKILGE